MVLRVPGTGALYEDDFLRYLSVGKPSDLSSGRTRGGKEALEGQAVDHILDQPSAVLAQVCQVVGVIPGSDDDGAHFFFANFINMSEINRLFGTEITADHAFDAPVRIDHHFIGNRLRERPVDGFSLIQGLLKLRRHFKRAFFHTGTAAVTLIPIHIAGLFLNLYLEISHVTGDAHYLRVGHEPYVFILANFHHPWRQDALGAVQGREGLGKLGHPPADGRLLFHQYYFIAAAGNIQGDLNSADTCPDNQGSPFYRHPDRLKVLVQESFLDDRLDDQHGFAGGDFFVLVHPTALLPDIGDFASVRIEAPGP